ncbi:MAG: hypothetical protein JST75_18800 [Bacteroidetes bacterium]|nr:hypothetical protein [Bacteroidota bacterium]
MTKRRLYIYLFIVIGSISGLNAQQFSPSSALDVWRKTNLQEKLYVHTDKNMYMPGEIAWFKIYYLDGFFHRPLQLSEIAYVELIDHTNKPVIQTMVSLEKSDGNGSFTIPSALNTGYYKLRCYTQWMRNFDEHFFFEKLIGIVNIQENRNDSSISVAETYDVGFFPEGGNMIDGVESRIAFHITDQHGKGIGGNGIILDGKDTLLHFETRKMGMGNFMLKPMAGHSYRAQITLGNGSTITKQLPSSLAVGTVMRIDETKDEKLIIHIASKSNAPLYIFAHTRGVIKMASAVVLANGAGIVQVDKNILDEGITQFTVFENNQPICERLYFTFPRKQFQIDASTDTSIYERRKKIKIHINAKNEKGAAVFSKMSTAIYRLDSLQEPDEMNIQNYLLLTSDLKGYIESPSWYFKDGEGAREAIDNLMLTQGWRRFVWSEVLQEKKPLLSYAPEYNGEIISARITDKRTGSLVGNVPVFLSIPGSDTRFWSSVSDAEGIANFEIKNSFGNREFILQSPDSNASINFISPFSTKFSEYPAPAFSVSKFDSVLLSKRNIYAQVQQAYHEKMLDSFKLYREDQAPFFLKPDFSYTLDRFTRFSTMEEVLREYIREVNVVNYGGSFHLHVMNGNNRMPFQTDPLILLDGVAMLDMNKFMNYDPFKIKTIDVVTHKYFLGNMSYFGIIDCKTYKGDMNGYALDPRSVILDFDGLQQQREFYAPSYETPQESASRLPDFRTLLYWNPALKTNEGNADVEFFSSDAAGRYVVVIEGISEKGIPAFTNLYFTVKK